MIKIFLFILFVITSNNAIASVKGNTLICDKDKRGFNFITRNKVEVFSINFDELNIDATKIFLPESSNLFGKNCDNKIIFYED